MTGQEIKDLVLDVIQETSLPVSDATFLILVNVAKNRREDERPWQFLKECDATQSASPGDSFDTLKSLPSDFRRMISVFVGQDYQHFPIPYERRFNYKDGARKYYIDLKRSKLGIIGAPGATQTIYQNYIVATDNIALETEPQYWPVRFHPLLGFDVAGYLTAGVDADDIYARMSPFHRQAAEQLYAAMKDWDDELKLEAMDHSSTPFLNETNAHYPDLSNLSNM